MRLRLTAVALAALLMCNALSAQTLNIDLDKKARAARKGVKELPAARLLVFDTAGAISIRLKDTSQIVHGRLAGVRFTEQPGIEDFSARLAYLLRVAYVGRDVRYAYYRGKGDTVPGFFLFVERRNPSFTSPTGGTFVRTEKEFVNGDLLRLGLAAFDTDGRFPLRAELEKMIPSPAPTVEVVEKNLDALVALYMQETETDNFTSFSRPAAPGDIPADALNQMFIGTEARGILNVYRSPYEYSQYSVPEYYPAGGYPYSTYYPSPYYSGGLRYGYSYYTYRPYQYYSWWHPLAYRNSRYPSCTIRYPYSPGGSYYRPPAYRGTSFKSGWSYYPYGGACVGRIRVPLLGTVNVYPKPRGFVR